MLSLQLNSREDVGVSACGCNIRQSESGWMTAEVGVNGGCLMLQIGVTGSIV